MFRLKEQQLHMLIWLIAGTSILLFCILGIERIPTVDEKGSWKEMQNFSDGWICTYETIDEGKLLEYKKTKGTKEDEKKDTIVEVVSFPSVLSVKKDTVLTMLHQVPDINLETVYMTIELDNASVRILIDQKVIYESNKKEAMLPVRHVVPIQPQYKDKMMTIEIDGQAGEKIEIGLLQSGNYNQLWVTTLKENGVAAVIGLLLICLSVCFLIVWKVIKNAWHQKRLLLYACLEGLLIGVWCLLDGNLLTLMTGWHYGAYMLKACVTIVAIVLHLTMIRCFVYKKKVLALIDTSILIVCIFFISVMVLQAFSLIHFDLIYLLGKILYSVCVVLFTIVLAITIFDYKRREGMPVFVANMLLILCMLTQVILQFSGREIAIDDIYIRIGFLLYMLYIWVYGMRQAFYILPNKDDLSLDESQIRKQIVEQINPNLLFASFHTLQSLIKNGSDKSVKMIYYISVYLRHNLKALESANEIVSFEDELEHIIAYLQLQKTRNMNLDFAIECKVKEFNIPRHSLEPLVENAVKHGIAKNGNAGNVAIRTYMRADGYAVQIIDNGAGFDWNQVKKGSTSLSKTLDILESTCQARTEVISKAGKGTVITIVLPTLENDLMEDLDITEG